MDINQFISSGIIEMYVMGLCNADEKAEVENLRRQHSSVAEAILIAEIEMEQRLMKNETLPSLQTDEKILAQLNNLQTPVILIEPNKFRNNLGWLKFVAAASIILLLISGYFNYSLFKKNKAMLVQQPADKENVATLPLSDYKILNDPTITPVAMYGVGSHAICRCTMFWDKKTGKAYIIIHHLPKSSSAKDYQLWALVDGKPVSVGIIKDEIRGRFIEMQNMPFNATAFTVTLEKAGGVTTPTVAETYLRGEI